MQLVKVKLNHVARKLDVMILHFGSETKEFLEGIWNDPRHLFWALNRISFPWACLTICKQANVVSIDCWLHKHPSIFKNFSLTWGFTKAGVKLVLFVFKPWLGVYVVFFDA
jgi:hypothetical protein